MILGMGATWIAITTGWHVSRLSLRGAVLAAALLATSPGVASAQEAGTTTGHLAEACRHVTNPAGVANNDRAFGPASFCMGYIFGVMNGLMAEKIATGSEEYCLPRGTTMGQHVRVFSNWADQRPELWHRPMYNSLRASLISAYPCADE